MQVLYLSVNPPMQAEQLGYAFLQFIEPMHFLFWRAVPKAQFMQAESSDGSVAIHGDSFLTHFPLESRL